MTEMTKAEKIHELSSDLAALEKIISRMGGPSNPDIAHYVAKKSEFIRRLAALRGEPEGPPPED